MSTFIEGQMKHLKQNIIYASFNDAILLYEKVHAGRDPCYEEFDKRWDNFK